tara:strand:- start:424 stop:708 length:285 start_codon:yes stop_codon:yes gene_type:complete
MRNETTVTYMKNGTVKLIMPKDNYIKLLQGNNDLKSAVSMMNECHTIYLEDLGKLEALDFRMADILGFKRKTQQGNQYYYGDYVLSNHPRAEKD